MTNAYARRCLKNVCALVRSRLTVNFVQQRLLGVAPQLLCVDCCLQSPLTTNSAFRISRFLVCAVFFFLMVQQPPLRARASSFTSFLDHKQRLTTVGRTHLDERSARRRDLYLTTRNT